MGQRETRSGLGGNWLTLIYQEVVSCRSEISFTTIRGSVGSSYTMMTTPASPHTCTYTQMHT